MLPDDAHSLMSSYNRDIKNAKKEVYIFSSTLNEYTLIHTLKQLSKRDIPIIIISAEALEKEDKTGYLSLFKNISLFTMPSLSSREIKGSIICIDDDKFYLISQTLEEKRLKERYAFAMYKQIECSYLFKTLLQRSQPF